jgi:DNA adenine methylase
MILPWVGGKSQLAEQIIGTFSPHKRYIEPFFGAGWVFFKKRPAEESIINDINSNLMNLYTVIRDHPHDLVKLMYWTPLDENLFNEWMELYHKRPKEYKRLDSVIRALIYFYLIRISFNGLMTSFGVSHAKSARWMSDGLLETIHKVSLRLKTTIICNRDYGEILQSYTTPETLVYLDPPYAVTIKDQTQYYEYTLNQSEHESLKHLLTDVPYRWVLSYDIHPLVEELYSDMEGVYMHKTKSLYQSSINKHGRFVGEDSLKNSVKQEYLITNFPINEALPLFT